MAIAGWFWIATDWPSGGLAVIGAALVCAFQVSVGLLLLSITAPTALAEERIRGSLDVLMATPLESCW